MVLPLTLARWLQFSHHHVPSVATFVATSIFHLSGAVNVLLLFIIRPGLLLFPRRVQLDEPEIQLTAREDTGVAISSDTDTTKFQHSPEPTLAVRGGEVPRDSTTPCHIGSRRRSDDDI